MKTATYTESVTVEEVTVPESDKKSLQAGKPSYGNQWRMDGTGKDAVFSTIGAIKGVSVVMNEGDCVITFPDGSQELIKKEDAKTKLTGMKEIKAQKVDTTVVDSTLAERAAANNQSLLMQGTQEAKIANDIKNGPTAAKVEATK